MNEPTVQDKQILETVGSAFTRANWKKANPLFYNRYPSVPHLPRDEGPTDDPEPED